MEPGAVPPMQPVLDLLVNAGLVAGLVEAIKRALGPRYDSERFGSLFTLAVGVAMALAGVELGWYRPQVTSGEAVLAGLVAGLTASGLYRGVTSANGGSNGKAPAASPADELHRARTRAQR